MNFSVDNAKNPPKQAQAMGFQSLNIIHCIIVSKRTVMTPPKKISMINRSKSSLFKSQIEGLEILIKEEKT